MTTDEPIEPTKHDVILQGTETGRFIQPAAPIIEGAELLVTLVTTYKQRSKGDRAARVWRSGGDHRVYIQLPSGELYRLSLDCEARIKKLPGSVAP